MAVQRLIVLKFGGSVLPNADALLDVVQEIHRWRREGWQVVAVVSALAGRTAELLESTRSRHLTPDDHAVASVLANGERESASLLGVQLDRCGVDAAVLAPEAIDFRATGPARDAAPVSVDVNALQRHLDAHGAVVVPGFFASDERGRTVVLGRGGSDLTALYLAHALGAQRCRLVKDVDGLYEADPARIEPKPARYARASYVDALATDGSIVQHKAIRLARDLGIRFELGRLNGTAPTVINEGPSRTSVSDDVPKPLRVALLGRGTVGGGVLRALSRHPLPISVTNCAVRTLGAHASVADDVRLTTDPIRAATAPDVDIVVECAGDDRGIHDAVIAALSLGRPVVSAGKALLAREGPQLHAIARRHGTTLRSSAAVGGAVPALEFAQQHGASVCAVQGVLNGTCNAVLDAVADGASIEAAVVAAKQRGLAEADPSRDLGGDDAADKLQLIAATLGWSPKRVDVTPLDANAIERLCAARPSHSVLRQVSTLTPLTLRVRPCWVSVDDPCGQARDEGNVVVFTLDDQQQHVLRGRGAGRWATTTSVLGDVLAIARSWRGERTRDPAPASTVA